MTRQPKELLDQVREAMRLRRYAYSTEKTYVYWAKRFILYDDKRHPLEMGEQEISEFLTYLAADENVAASTQNQALSALLFLYREVLRRDLDLPIELVWAKRPRRLPTVLTREHRALCPSPAGTILLHTAPRIGPREGLTAAHVRPYTWDVRCDTPGRPSVGRGWEMMGDNEDASVGACRDCRHANHGTMDAQDGYWACPWLGATDPESQCRIRYASTGEYVFEQFNGSNCTWGTGDSVWRSPPGGYDTRKVVLADQKEPRSQKERRKWGAFWRRA